MKKYSSKKINSIVLSTGVVIFSLAAAFSGTIAWFNTTKAATVSAGSFQVINNSTASIGDIKLYKFVYQVDNSGFINYLQPSEGSVETYVYNSSNDTFENIHNGDNPQPAEYKRVANVMNLFDPAAYEMYGIRDLYCNAVYVIPVSGSSLDNLKVYANIIEREDPEEEEENSSSQEEEEVVSIDLSQYVDFDVYSYSHIEAADSAHSLDPKYYYPSHMSSEDPEPSDPDDCLFYKIDYLSANKSSSAHKHFYGGSATTLRIDDETLSFDSDSGYIYINVNYAPSQLEKYARSLINERINAVYDFYFSIEL